MEIGSLSCLTDLAFLRLGGSLSEDRGDHLVVRSPHNPTFWWGNFLLLERAPAGGDVPRWMERFESTFPDASHRAFGIADAGASPDDVAGFVTAGCTVETSSVMTADVGAVHEPPFPNRDVEIRRLTTAEDWHRRAELDVDCRREDLPESDHRVFAHRSAATTRRLSEAGHGAWFGAFDGGRMLSSLGLFVAAPGLARYHVVLTHPSARRQGLAGTLVHHAARYGADEIGVGKLVMVADPDDVAIWVYRAVGFADTEVSVQVERSPSP